MIDETTAAVQLISTIAVGDFEMEELRAMLARGALGKAEKLGANSLPPVGGFDEEFVNPCALAVILQAVIEADHKVGDRRLVLADEIGDAKMRVREKRRQGLADGGFVERLAPRIVNLHAAHEEQKRVKIGESGNLKSRCS